MEYEVTDPKGIHVNGRQVQKGRIIALPDGAALKAFLHFKQVIPREVEKKPEKPSETSPADPPADKEPAKPKK